MALLPGVGANQDFYADFATRGAGLAHTGVYIDGVLVDHPAYVLEDSGDLGSISVVNGDVVGSTSLLSGAFPAPYGNRTGAILDVATRDGARDRPATRVIADVLGVAVTSEGPIGRRKQASWLVSGRQSYLAYLLRELNDSSNLTLNYDDLTGKVSYDVNAHHRLSFLSSFGADSASRSINNTAGQAASEFTAGGARHGMEAVHWDWIVTPGTLLQSEGFWTYDHEHDTNSGGAVDLDTTSNVWGGRVDLTHESGGSNKLQAGGESRAPSQQRNSTTQWNYAAQRLSNSLIPLDSYSQTVRQSGGYAQDTLALWNKRLVVDVGGRLANFAPVSESVVLPHASALIRASKTTTASLAFGQYAQMPSALQLFGAFGNPALKAERATHETFAVDQFLTEKVRVHVEMYNRQEHGDVYSPLTEFRLLANGQVGFPVRGAVEGNALKSYARGLEILVQRRSANRLSGWIAYARSYSKYWQPRTMLSFAGDFDQRDTFSAYAAYRITRTIDVSANTRYGSGMPIAGYYAALPGSTPGEGFVELALSSSRNTLRQDGYMRSDVRINKVFTGRHFHLTAHGEIENLTGHKNYSYYGFLYPANVAQYRDVYGTREATLPFLPVAGFTVEF